MQRVPVHVHAAIDDNLHMPREGKLHPVAGTTQGGLQPTIRGRFNVLAFVNARTDATACMHAPRYMDELFRP